MNMEMCHGTEGVDSETREGNTVTLPSSREFHTKEVAEFGVSAALVVYVATECVLVGGHEAAVRGHTQPLVILN
ncbi:hypothetical protein E2C01_091164 [Portunus trituberculatus]|uniref:Uncharacterized protein n=1 Tax=Portunus trituberculatus TaxID=210409 RepID=A0A5B7JMU5_PORTR|nr:hypothetical protein [Portunus trituberculatus]